MHRTNPKDPINCSSAALEEGKEKIERRREKKERHREGRKEGRKRGKEGKGRGETGGEDLRSGGSRIFPQDHASLAGCLPDCLPALH